MTQDKFMLITSITAIVSSVTAIVAIVIAVFVEIRTNRRFSEQLKREERLALANLKPLLAVYPSIFINHKAVTLHNYGIGTAVITSISFSKGSKVDNLSLVNLFSFPQRIIWDYFWNFRQKRYYLQQGQDIILLKLTDKKLSDQGLGKVAIKSILDSWQEQMNGIAIKITYEDIVGNPQEDYEIILGI